MSGFLVRSPFQFSETRAVVIPLYSLTIVHRQGAIHAFDLTPVSQLAHVNCSLVCELLVFVAWFEDKYRGRRRPVGGNSGGPFGCRHAVAGSRNRARHAPLRRGGVVPDTTWRNTSLFQDGARPGSPTRADFGSDSVTA